jgi:hypothetical protein
MLRQRLYPFVLSLLPGETPTSLTLTRARRTFAKDAIARAHKDRCGQRFATAITGHIAIIRTSVGRRRGASTATHEAPSRHGEQLMNSESKDALFVLQWRNGRHE